MRSIGRQVYVISDLHLGGVYPENGALGRGFRINTHVPHLTEFITLLARSPIGGPKIELIINGDMVDFLAERASSPPEWIPFAIDPEVACLRLETIAGRDRHFFEALSNLMRAGHRLTILVGNHDVELTLPQVRRKLECILAVEGHHDYRIIYNGEAYIIGDALIEHGNRYDCFNVVDYDSLRRISSLLSRRQEIPEKYVWNGPAGSKMVAWVMNPIKEDYNFIDLLKPENGAAIPLLLALEPGYRGRLATVARLALEASRHALEKPAMPSFGGDINAQIVQIAQSSSDIGSVGPSFRDDTALEFFLSRHLEGDSASFLKQVGADPAAPQMGADISTMETVDRSFGLIKLLLGRQHSAVGERLQALYKAMRAVQNDKSFDPSVEAAQEYLSAAQELTRRGFRYVLFGHTHHPKKVKLQGNGWYLNSGAWVDIMRVPTEILSGTQETAIQALSQFVKAIAQGDLSRWIIYRPTYIRLDLDAEEKVASANVYEYKGLAEPVAIA